MEITMIIIIVILSLIIVYLFNENNKNKKINIQKHTDIQKYNEELEEKNKQLIIENNTNKIQYDKIKEQITSAKMEISSLASEVNSLRDRKIEISNELQKETNNLNNLKQNINDNLENQKRIADEALINYKITLDTKYQEMDKGYDELIAKLEEVYSNRQAELFAESNQIRNDLEKIRASRAAAIQAQLRERQIEENKDDFRLDLDGKSLGDIKILKSVQNQISNPIVIDKIIWSNYYQPLAKTKFPKIIGKAECCGIYKLTSLVTGEVYIGQSKTICDRWKEHCKNALGIGTTTVRNKLYSAIKRDGLENYTFEVLEECSIKDLNEKEKYYISLYDSYNFGLNATQGNN